MAGPGSTVVFVHGAWVTARCWDPFLRFFAERGYDCLAPNWPGKDRPVEAIRADPSPLRGLGIGEIVDHYAQIVAGLPEPPILVGHSFGGLFVQILLDRGLGSAGVAIDSAPPRGVFVTQPSAVRANGRVLFTPRGWRRVIPPSYRAFRYGFVHTMPEAKARQVYEEQVIPESGRPFFQAAFAAAARNSPAAVNFANPHRAPLLLIAGSSDHIVPPGINRANLRRYRRSPARTDFIEFPNRTHWIIADEGWEEVATRSCAWVESLPPSA